MGKAFCFSLKEEIRSIFQKVHFGGSVENALFKVAIDKIVHNIEVKKCKW